MRAVVRKLTTGAPFSGSDDPDVGGAGPANTWADDLPTRDHFDEWAPAVSIVNQGGSVGTSKGMMIWYDSRELDAQDPFGPIPTVQVRGGDTLDLTNWVGSWRVSNPPPGPVPWHLTDPWGHFE